MTFEDFEKAKRIIDQQCKASSNIIALREIITCASLRPTHDHTYHVTFNNDHRTEILVDLEFVEMVLEYYENKHKTLGAEFDALGKENNK